MSASSKRRSRRPAQDSLRPGWMVNCILFCVLLAGIGGCYVWLGAKKKDRADQILSMHREIDLLKKQIKEKDMQISRRLAPEDLRVRVEKVGMELKPIDIGPRGKLVRLPDPVLADESEGQVPVLAGNNQP
ncbi:MAG: hypothetical protein JWL81_3134 [Verrucomicrobiales bacterium]|nr:hypothetical protein [Verrucomicrobiales bacterium]